tara:strand:- start:461 stop:1081 length:621 start_codon:yes stop_codon:yes gene_type:complete
MPPNKQFNQFKIQAMKTRKRQTNPITIKKVENWLKDIVENDRISANTVLSLRKKHNISCGFFKSMKDLGLAKKINRGLYALTLKPTDVQPIHAKRIIDNTNQKQNIKKNYKKSKHNMTNPKKTRNEIKYAITNANERSEYDRLYKKIETDSSFIIQCFKDVLVFQKENQANLKFLMKKREIDNTTYRKQEVKFSILWGLINYVKTK